MKSFHKIGTIAGPGRGIVPFSWADPFSCVSPNLYNIHHRVYIDFIQNSNITNTLGALKILQKPFKICPDALLAPGRASLRHCWPGMGKGVYKLLAFPSSAFHEMNTKKNRFLDFDEFKAGFSSAGLDKESLLTCFKEINKYGGNKGINLQEFLIALQVCLHVFSSTA